MSTAEQTPPANDSLHAEALRMLRSLVGDGQAQFKDGQYEAVEALVTEGPFSETAEQVVGFYLVESGDEAALRAACERFASRGEHIELRKLAE